MADDQNKSGKGPQNRISSTPDYMDESSHYSTVERIAEMNRPKSEKYRQDLEEIKRRQQEVKDYEFYLSQNPNEKGPLSEALISDEMAEIAKRQSRVTSMESRAQERAASQYSTFLGRTYSESHIRGQVGRLQRMNQTQSAGLYGATKSYDELEEYRQQSQAKLRQLHRQSEELNKRMWLPGGQVDPEVSHQMETLHAAAEIEQKRLAGFEAGQRGHKLMKTDPQSKVDRAYELIKAAQEQQQYKELRQKGEVKIQDEQGERAVKFGSQVSKELENQTEKLAQLFKQLGETTEDETAKRKELTESIGKTAENIDKLQQAVGAGGGRRDFSNALSVASSGFQAIGNAYQAITVGQRIQQQNNIAGFAGIENEKYDMYRKARAGDIQSQMLLGQWDQAAEFGSELQMDTKIGQGMRATGHAAQATAGALKVGAAGAGAVQSFITGGTGANATAAAQGTQEFIGGTAAAITEAAAIARNIEGGQANIAAQQARMSALKGLTYVQSQQLQGFRDYAVGAGQVSLQMGSKGAEFMNEAVSDTGMQKMIDARMSPEMFNQMAQIGVEQVGSTFATDQIYTARNLERAGFGSAQQNMQRMATLASAGANNPQAGLGSVLEAAFSKSLEGSKVLNMMVENTATLAQQSSTASALGLDAIGSSAKLLAAGVDPNAQNQELAVQRAMSARQIAEEARTNAGVNFAGMVATSRLAKTMGVSTDDAIIAQQMKDAEVDELLALTKDPKNAENMKKARETYARKGIDVSKKSDEDIAKMTLSLEESKFMSLLEGGGAGFAAMSDKDRQLLFKNKQKLGELAANPDAIKDPELRSAILNYNKSVSLKTGGAALGEEVARSGTAVGTEVLKPKEGKPSAEDAMAGKGASPEQQKAWEMATSGMRQMAEAAKAGTKAFEGAKGAFEALSELSKKYEASADQIEKKMSTAAAESANDFKSSVGVFNVGANTILEAAKILANKAGIDAPDVKDFKKEIESQDKIKDEKK